MNILSRARVQLRAAAHRRASSLPGWLRRGGGPSSLWIALDGAQPLQVWQDRVLDLFLAHGPVPVTIAADADCALLPDVVRFCHRLDVPVTVRTGAAGLDLRAAESLVDAGARRVVVLAPTAEAFVALVAARTSRGARMDLEAEATAAASITDARGWVASGADGVRVAAGWTGAPPEPWPLRDLIASFQRTPPELWRALSRMAGESEPGAPRQAGTCGAVSRLVLDSAGLHQCPWKSGGGADSWAALDGQRAEIRACRRDCWHPSVR